MAQFNCGIDLHARQMYVCVVDRQGNMVSLIQSNFGSFGSGLVPDGAGFVLQNRGALFTLEANHPNTLAPRKRPLHTIIPAFMEKEGTRIGFGIMGGWTQSQAHAQFVSNIVDHGMTIQQALAHSIWGASSQWYGRLSTPTQTSCSPGHSGRLTSSTQT